jgi:YspA, cpYpsA-related SLOG family
MIALVTGGRDYVPTRADAWALRSVLEEYRCTAVMHGGCRGVDEWAGRVAERLGLSVLLRSADWPRHGKAAGPRRNAAMVAEVAAAGGLVVALPGGRGTTDCVRQAETAGLPVLRVG